MQTVQKVIGYCFQLERTIHILAIYEVVGSCSYLIVIAKSKVIVGLSNYCDTNYLASYLNRYWHALGKKMKILNIQKAKKTQDGDGVNISRVADFSGKALDPFLMLDELKSNNENDYIGGFPAHPHRGIETFTYMIKGGFEHKDQLGNKKVIEAGNVQWMSTGYGVIHSEMPIADPKDGIHGFQIWLNMPAINKLRPARYQDSTSLPVLVNKTGACLKLLAGQWQLNGNEASSPLVDLSAGGAIADLSLQSHGQVELDLAHFDNVLVYVHSGAFSEPKVTAGHLIIVEPKELLTFTADKYGAGALVLAGNRINEDIVHYGPFVMNSEEEIRTAITDYNAGKFGTI